MSDNLTQEEISILKYIDKNVYTDRAEAFRLFSSTSDYSIDELLKLEYLRAIPPNDDKQLTWFSLTSKGQSFIYDYNIAEYEKEQELQVLRKEAIFSKKIAILSLAVSVASVIVQIIIG